MAKSGTHLIFITKQIFDIFRAFRKAVVDFHPLWTLQVSDKCIRNFVLYHSKA